MIIFCHDDLDGWASAAIVLSLNPGAKVVKVNYGEEEAALHKYSLIDEEIVIVDFTFPYEKMLSLADMTKAGHYKDLIHIDHHVSAKKKTQNLWDDPAIKGLRKIDQGSAALLSWQYFYHDLPVPGIIDDISRYDTWDFGDREVIVKPNVAYLHVLLGNYYPDEPYSATWNSLLFKKDPINAYAVFAGQYLLSASDQHAIKAVEKGIVKNTNWKVQEEKEVARFSKHNTLFVNSDTDISLIGEKVYNDGHDIAAIWYMKGDRIEVGLRSRKVDVQAIAIQYGGGGHRSASGFSMMPQEFLELLEQ